jgi:DNA-directed RNA polymerase subunit RPC12/RpoP
MRGKVRLRDPEGFPACPFCGTGLVLDRTGVRPHLLYRPRVTPAQAIPLLRRWAERRGMSASPGAEPPRLVYYPFWRYTREGPRRLVPAWSTLEAQWPLSLPEAEQVFDAAHVQGAMSSVHRAGRRRPAAAAKDPRPRATVHLPAYKDHHASWSTRLPAATSLPGKVAGRARHQGTRAAGGRRRLMADGAGDPGVGADMPIRFAATASAARPRHGVLVPKVAERALMGLVHLDCPSCGGALSLAEGERIVACRYCRSQSLVDVPGAVPRHIVQPAIDEAAADRVARGSLQRPDVARAARGTRFDSVTLCRLTRRRPSDSGHSCATG